MNQYVPIVEPVKAVQLRVADEQFPPGFNAWRHPMHDGTVGFIGTAQGACALRDHDWVTYDAQTEKPLGIVPGSEFGRKFWPVAPAGNIASELSPKSRA